MRIALMTSVKGWRGSSASYAKIAQGLSAREHQVRLITTAPGLTSRFAQEGVSVAEIPGRNTGPREAWMLARALRSMQAQVIVVDTPRDLRLAVWASLLHRAKIVYRYNLNYRPARTDLADRLYAARVAACVFQSRFIQEEVKRQEPRIARARSFHIPNGYDSTRFAPRPDAARAFRQKWNIPDAARVVLTSAKLTENKGHDVAIKALDRVRRGGIDLVYVVCGDGPKGPDLHASALAIHLPTRFTGLLDIDELIGALSSADVVLHPSMQEIFPNAVGEAMSCARAVVAADAGGTAELLGRDGSTGVLVPPADPGVMAAAVTSLLEDPARRERIGAAARRRIQSEFPLKHMIDGYEAALQEVVLDGG